MIITRFEIITIINTLLSGEKRKLMFRGEIMNRHSTDKGRGTVHVISLELEELLYLRY